MKKANLLSMEIVDEGRTSQPSASSALSVNVSVSEREMLPLSSPAPGTAEPDDFDENIGQFG